MTSVKNAQTKVRQPLSPGRCRIILVILRTSLGQGANEAVMSSARQAATCRVEAEQGLRILGHTGWDSPDLGTTPLTRSWLWGLI